MVNDAPRELLEDPNPGLFRGSLHPLLSARHDRLRRHLRRYEYRPRPLRNVWQFLHGRNGVQRRRMQPLLSGRADRVRRLLPLGVFASPFVLVQGTSFGERTVLPNLI